jgi:hypothetical protein
MMAVTKAVGVLTNHIIIFTRHLHRIPNVLPEAIVSFELGRNSDLDRPQPVIWIQSPVSSSWF